MPPSAAQVYRTEAFKTGHLVLIAILIGCIILISACGKKAPPIPSTSVAPPTVAGLEITLNDDMMTLQWPVPDWDKKDENALAGFYVYRSRSALSEPECEGCPLTFQKTADIRIENHPSRERYEERLEKGFRYTYKVSAYTESGYEGESSEIARVDY